MALTRWLGVAVLGLAGAAGCRVNSPETSTAGGALAVATWKEVPLLIRRQGGAMATLGNNVVLFGGLGNDVHADTWIWDGSTWTRQTPAVSPPARSHAMMAALGNKLVLFGGTP